MSDILVVRLLFSVDHFSVKGLGHKAMHVQRQVTFSLIVLLGSLEQDHQFQIVCGHRKQGMPQYVNFTDRSVTVHGGIKS